MKELVLLNYPTIVLTDFTGLHKNNGWLRPCDTPDIAWCIDNNRTSYYLPMPVRLWVLLNLIKENFTIY